MVQWLNDSDIWVWLDTEHNSFRLTQLELLLKASRSNSKKTYLQKIADALLISDYPGDTVPFQTPITNVWTWLLEGSLENSRYRNLCKWISTYCQVTPDDSRNYERVARILKINDEKLPIEITNDQNEKTIMVVNKSEVQAQTEYIPTVFVNTTPIDINIMPSLMFMIHDIHQTTMNAISEIIDGSDLDSSSETESSHQRITIEEVID